jgi:septum formation protein
VLQSGRRIVLASRSPRRKQLLAGAGYDVTINAVDADESWPPGRFAAALHTICHRKIEHAKPYELPTVAADTVVVLGSKRFGKPADADEARGFLTTLSGREHWVMTGFCVRLRDAEISSVVTTRVQFRHLTRLEIEHYVASGEAFDKAGGYGIQGEGGALVETLVGSYTNVVGLPLTEVRGAIEHLAMEGRK